MLWSFAAMGQGATDAKTASAEISNALLVKKIISEKAAVREDSLRRNMLELFRRGAFADIISVGGSLWNHGKKAGDKAMMMDASLFLGQGYVSVNRMDSANFYLEKALLLGKELGDYWIIARVNDTYGVIAMVSRCDFQEAFNYFYAALKALEQIDDKNVNDRNMRYGVLINLAMAYFYRGDPEGMEYAKEVYRAGKELHYDFFTFAGSLIFSHFLYQKGDYGEALQKIREAEQLVDKYSNHTEVFMLHANILAKLGDRANAAIYYEHAMKRVDETELPVKVNLYLDYGRFLTGEGKLELSEKTLKRGLEIVDSLQIRVFRYKFYEALSAVSEKMNRPVQALAYYKAFYAESDSLFNLEKERALGELQVKYHSEQRERELREKELKLVRERQKVSLAIGVIIVFLLITAGLVLLYRHKNKMYLNLVKQYYDFRQRQALVEKAAADVALEEPADADMERKDKRLFELLQQKMNSDELWRNNDLSVDRLASLLETNRSYLSRIINNIAGMSFNHYVNGFRINEAVKVLSDEDDDTPLKQLALNIGFNSLTTFYSSFQREIGVPPAKFRENWRKISLGNQLANAD